MAKRNISFKFNSNLLEEEQWKKCGYCSSRTVCHWTRCSSQLQWPTLHKWHQNTRMRCHSGWRRSSQLSGWNGGCLETDERTLDTSGTIPGFTIFESRKFYIEHRFFTSKVLKIGITRSLELCRKLNLYNENFQKMRILWLKIFYN